MSFVFHPFRNPLRNPNHNRNPRARMVQDTHTNDKTKPVFHCTPPLCDLPGSSGAAREARKNFRLRCRISDHSHTKIINFDATDMESEEIAWRHQVFHDSARGIASSDATDMDLTNFGPLDHTLGAEARFLHVRAAPDILRTSSGHPPDFLRTSSGHPPDILRTSSGYPPDILRISSG